MLVLPVFVVFEVCPGYGQPTTRFAGPRREVLACALWERCHSKYGATFRAVTPDGIECGTPRPGDQHGVKGVLQERCADCEQMFATALVGASLCPGCELLSIGSINLWQVE